MLFCYSYGMSQYTPHPDLPSISKLPPALHGMFFLTSGKCDPTCTNCPPEEWSERLTYGSQAYQAANRDMVAAWESSEDYEAHMKRYATWAGESVA